MTPNPSCQTLDLTKHIMPSFVTNTVELADSVRAFMDAPEYWRDAIGNHPKYFVHVEGSTEQLFGLSKFCAFRDISLEDYITGLRRTTGGGTTQKHLSRVCGKEWTPLMSTPRQLQEEFRKWFNELTEGKLSINDIYLLTVDLEAKPRARIKRIVSPEELQRRLAAQTNVGHIGEVIALAHEKARLLSLGATKVTIDLQQVSLVNTAAGFDIRSAYKKKIRYIEVKASTSIDSAIYVSPNEIATLQKHGQSAYLYIVHVTDVRKRVGTVIREIQNPFESGQETAWISPVLFTGKPPRK